MKKLLFTALTIAALYSGELAAQRIAGSVFLKGQFVEVGTHITAAFGAGATPPTGYHLGPRMSTLGFVSDPDKDGWLVGSPGKTAYMGDYFVPGSPYEGWELEINGTKRRNYANGMTVAEIAMTSSTYTTSATEEVATWTGSTGGIDITQRVVLKKDKLYFVIYVDMVNSGATTLNNIYYYRGLDPDNEQNWSGSFNTKNTIVYQPNTLSKNCLATATGITYGTFAYLGLGTKDCRAKCLQPEPSWFPGNLEQTYAGTGAASGNQYNVGWTTPSASGDDEAIGIVWNLGSLAPGQRTSLAFAYILNRADLDSALNETAPKFKSGSATYAPYTTFRACPGRTVPLGILNGGQYKWIWTPADTPHRMTAVGSATLVPPGGTVPAVTGTMTFPHGAVYGDSIEVTVKGPKTYLATGYSNCDTQFLYFSVDTISFVVPPSVTSPVRYCEGDVATALTAGAAAGAFLKWYDDAGNFLAGGAPTPSTAVPAGGDDTTTYYVSQENTGGCETPKAKIDVIVIRRPGLPVVKNLVYCQGDTTKMLEASGLNNKWYDAATAGLEYPSPPVPSSAAPKILSYWVSQTVNGCESDRAQLDVEISAITASVTTAKDSLCGAESMDFLNTSVSTSTPGTFTSMWSFGDGKGPFESRDYTYRYPNERGTYTVVLDVENIHGCKGTTSKVIEVFSEPVMSLSGSTDKICQGEAIDFTGTATAGYKGLVWDFSDNDPAYNSLTVRHAFSKAGMHTVRLNGNFPACPGTFASVPVEVVAIPKVNLGADTGFCAGNTALKLYNLSGATVDGKYMWSTGDTTPSINVRNVGQYSLRVQSWQCSASDSIKVTKACYLNIPNAFTPGSGNDYDNYFMPRDLMGKSVVTFSMQIYDRWGQLIFETDKVNGRGWDGNYKGQAMRVGVYVYTIRVSFANGVSESYDGNVTLLR